MITPAVASSLSDRNLLFGIFALQMGFIDRDAIVKGMKAWLADKTKSLGRILCEQGSLTDDECNVLETLVSTHLQKHENDAGKSLASIHSVGDFRRQFGDLDDNDLQASMAHVGGAPREVDKQPSPGAPEEEDPFATRVGSTDSPSTPVRRFRILRPHAKGGLGEVSVALDGELDREVALKEIRAKFADNIDSRARFLAEAKITGGLEHPGIVPVYGLGQYADGRPYYAMRLIKGDDLKEAAKRFHEQSPRMSPGTRALEFRKLLGRFLDVCHAIAYAHSRGVLHRDLKPSNVMLGPYGETLVVDWGLAKVMGAKESAQAQSVQAQSVQVPRERPLKLSSGSASGSSSETLQGSAVGTPQYMPPEQAEGRLDVIGVASDVYGLGATLYHLLTDKPPFNESDAGAVLKQVARGDFRKPCDVSPGVSPALQAICLKAMALEPKDRYPTPQALADDVEKWLADEPVSAWKEPWTIRARRWARRHQTIVTAAAVLVLALALGAILVNRERARAAIEHAEFEAESVKTQAEKERADDEKRRAEALTEEKLLRKVDNYTSSGLRALDDGKMEEALVWFAGALELDHQDPARAAMHRLRFGVALQHSSKALALAHNSSVNGAVFSPIDKDRRVVTFSDDGTAQIWDAATGQPIGPLLRHSDTVRDASFSPDGRLVVTASNDRTAAIWEVGTGERLLVFQHGGPVRRAAFSADGRRVATASQDNTVRVWDASTGERLCSLDHKAFPYFVAFSPDGKRLVTACADEKKSVRIWDWTEQLGEKKLLIAPIENDDYVIFAAFSPGGDRIVTAARNGTVEVRECTTGRRVALPFQHEPVSQMERAALTYDGKHVVTIGKSGTTTLTMLWNAETGKKVGPARSSWIDNPAHSPDGRYRLELSPNEPTVYIRDAAAGLPRSADLGKLRSASFARNGDSVITAGDKWVHVWDLRGSTPQRLGFESKGPIVQVWPSPDRKKVLAAHDDSFPMVWNSETNKSVVLSLSDKERLRFGAFSPDGQRVLTVSSTLAVFDDVDVRVWNASNGEKIAELPRHGKQILHAEFSPNGKLVLSSGQDNKAQLWEADTGKVRHEFHHKSWVRFGSFSPDGQKVATASSDRTARVWDVVSGQPLTEPLKHTAQVTQASFNAAGNRVVTASDDHTARIWDLGGPALILEHRSPVKNALFSPDGLTVLTVTDTNGRIWDATTGIAITPWLDQAKAKLLDATFVSGKLGICTVDAEGVVRWWDVPSYDRPVGDELRLAELLSGRHLDQTGGTSPLPLKDLREPWDVLKTKYADELRGPPQAAVMTWHRQEAKDAEKSAFWKAALPHLDALLAVKTAPADLYLKRGRIHAELGHWESAASDYAKVLEHDAMNAALLFQRGRAYFRSGSLDKALHDFAKVLEVDPNDGAYWLARSMVLAHLKRMKDAEDAYEKAVLHSRMHAPRVDCSWNQRYSGVTPLAQETLDHWHNVFEDCKANVEKTDKTEGAADAVGEKTLQTVWWLCRGSGLALGVMRNWQSAAEYFHQARVLKPDDWRSWQGEARCLAELGEWPKVLAAADEAIRLKEKGGQALTNDDWGSWYLAGISQKQLGRHDKAVDAYTKAIARQKALHQADQNAATYWGLYFERAWSRNLSGNHDGAIEDYTETLRYSTSAAAHNNRAIDYRAKGDLAGALDDYEEAIRLDPKTALYRRNLGNLYRDMAEFDKALAAFDEALRLDPKYAVGLVSRGDFYFSRADYDKAVSDYTKALKINANYDYAYSRRGQAHTSLRNFQKAVDDYTDAIRIHPTAALYNSRAYAYQQSGDRARAIADYLKSIDMDPTFTAASVNYANLMIADGKQEEAEVVFRAQVAAKKKLVTDNPLISSHRQTLAWACENLASFLADSGRLAEAESTCEEALSLRRNLAKEHAKERIYQTNLAGCLNKMESILLRRNKAKNAQETIRENLAVREKILKDFPSAESCNSLAWFLTVCPDPEFRDLKKAIALAQQAVAKSPGVGNYHNTLGVAQYRSGQWQEAVASLETSMKLAAGGGSVDWLFLAMAHQQLGDEKQARQWYDRAVKAMANDVLSEERRRFRDEAAILLKIAPKSP